MAKEDPSQDAAVEEGMEMDAGQQDNLFHPIDSKIATMGAGSVFQGATKCGARIIHKTPGPHGEATRDVGQDQDCP